MPGIWASCHEPAGHPIAENDLLLRGWDTVKGQRASIVRQGQAPISLVPRTTSSVLVRPPGREGGARG